MSGQYNIQHSKQPNIRDGKFVAQEEDEGDIIANEFSSDGVNEEDCKHILCVNS
jgi:hypothetical protein